MFNRIRRGKLSRAYILRTDPLPSLFNANTHPYKEGLYMSFLEHFFPDTLIFSIQASIATLLSKSFTMQITTAALFFFAAIGAVASPVESEPASINVGGDPVSRFEHPGVSPNPRPAVWLPNNGITANCSCSSNQKCTKAKDECRYEVNKKVRYVKCSTKVAVNYRVSWVLS
jgi:hypothetical protein